KSFDHYFIFTRHIGSGETKDSLLLHLPVGQPKQLLPLIRHMGLWLAHPLWICLTSRDAKALYRETVVVILQRKARQIVRFGGHIHHTIHCQWSQKVAIQDNAD